MNELEISMLHLATPHLVKLHFYITSLALSHRNWNDGAERFLLHTVQSPSPPPHCLGSAHSRVVFRPVIAANLWTFYFQWLETKALLCLSLCFGSGKVLALQGWEGWDTVSVFISFLFFNK